LSRIKLPRRIHNGGSQLPVGCFALVANKQTTSIFLAGITVTPDREGDGLIVRSIINGGAVASAGEPQIGDMIRKVNTDSAVGLGASQARALIRNHSMYSSDVT